MPGARQKAYPFRVISQGSSGGQVRVLARHQVRVVQPRLNIVNSGQLVAGAIASVEVQNFPATARLSVKAQAFLGGRWLDLPDAYGRTTAGIGRLSMTALPRSPVWVRAMGAGEEGTPVISIPVLTRLGHVVRIVAHRGGAGEAPENTVAAARMASNRGFSLEGDLRKTSDGHWVVLHDPTLTRTTNVIDVFPSRATAPVSSFTLAEVKQLDAGTWFSPQFAGASVPTLDEWLQASSGAPHIDLEVKGPGLTAADAQDLGRRFSAATADMHLGPITVSSVDAGWLTHLKAALPSLELGAVLGAAPGSAQLAALAGVASVVYLPVAAVNASVYSLTREAGLEVATYTVNSLSDMETALALSDAVVTDFPQRLALMMDPARPLVD